MIDYHCFCQIKHLHTQQGLNASQIARELSLDPRTVAYWLAQEHFRPRKPRPRTSKLDPFKQEIGRMLDRYPYSAAQVFQRLHAQGAVIIDHDNTSQIRGHWLDTVANVRVHSETKATPITLWHKERPSLRPLPLHPFDIATVSQVRASRQFRITLDTNRYSVPAHYAGQALTLKTYPDRLCLYHGDTLIARHTRRYNRFQDIEDPDHPKPLLEHRQKARAHQLFLRFLALSPRAEAYYLKLEERRLNPQHHVRKIVALSDIYTPEAVARALDDAFTYEAFSSEYIANLLEQRACFTPEASALHLTRRGDLLELNLAPPDLSLYQVPPSTEHSDR